MTDVVPTTRGHVRTLDFYSVRRILEFLFGTECLKDWTGLIVGGNTFYVRADNPTKVSFLPPWTLLNKKSVNLGDGPTRVEDIWSKHVHDFLHSVPGAIREWIIEALALDADSSALAQIFLGITEARKTSGTTHTTKSVVVSIPEKTGTAATLTTKGGRDTQKRNYAESSDSDERDDDSEFSGEEDDEDDSEVSGEEDDEDDALAEPITEEQQKIRRHNQATLKTQGCDISLRRIAAFVQSLEHTEEPRPSTLRLDQEDFMRAMQVLLWRGKEFPKEVVRPQVADGRMAALMDQSQVRTNLLSRLHFLTALSKHSQLQHIDHHRRSAQSMHREKVCTCHTPRNKFGWCGSGVRIENICPCCRPVVGNAGGRQKGLIQFRVLLPNSKRQLVFHIADFKENAMETFCLFLGRNIRECDIARSSLPSQADMIDGKCCLAVGVSTEEDDDLNIPNHDVRGEAEFQALFQRFKECKEAYMGRKLAFVLEFKGPNEALVNVRPSYRHVDGTRVGSPYHHSVNRQDTVVAEEGFVWADEWDKTKPTWNECLDGDLSRFQKRLTEADVRRIVGWVQLYDTKEEMEEKLWEHIYEVSNVPSQEKDGVRTFDHYDTKHRYLTLLSLRGVIRYQRSEFLEFLDQLRMCTRTPPFFNEASLISMLSLPSVHFGGLNLNRFCPFVCSGNLVLRTYAEVFRGAQFTQQASSFYDLDTMTRDHSYKMDQENAKIAFARQVKKAADATFVVSSHPIRSGWQEMDGAEWVRESGSLCLKLPSGHRVSPICIPLEGFEGTVTLDQLNHLMGEFPTRAAYRQFYDETCTRIDSKRHLLTAWFPETEDRRTRPRADFYFELCMLRQEKRVPGARYEYMGVERSTPYTLRSDIEHYGAATGHHAPATPCEEAKFWAQKESVEYTRGISIGERVAKLRSDYLTSTSHFGPSDSLVNAWRHQLLTCVVEKEKKKAEAAAQKAAAQKAAEPDWDEMDPPDQYVCSITGSVMTDPVITCDGHTYERSAIERWFRVLHKYTSPLTNARLANTNLIPNIVLRQVIEKWKRERMPSSSKRKPSETFEEVSSSSAPMKKPKSEPSEAGSSDSSKADWVAAIVAWSACKEGMMSTGVTGTYLDKWGTGTRLSVILVPQFILLPLTIDEATNWTKLGRNVYTRIIRVNIGKSKRKITIQTKYDGGSSILHTILKIDVKYNVSRVEINYLMDTERLNEMIKNSPNLFDDLETL